MVQNNTAQGASEAISSWARQLTENPDLYRIYREGLKRRRQSSQKKNGAYLTSFFFRHSTAFLVSTSNTKTEGLAQIAGSPKCWSSLRTTTHRVVARHGSDKSTCSTRTFAPRSSYVSKALSKTPNNRMLRSNNLRLGSDRKVTHAHGSTRSATLLGVASLG